jgi:hypothetical protein
MTHLERNRRRTPTHPGPANATLARVHVPITQIALALSVIFAPVFATSAVPAPRRPATTPQTWIVQNCSDHDPGSLRDIVENPANAQSGDIIDLSHLPTSCGIVNSVVTIGAEITIDQDDLTLVGPTQDQGSVTISAADASRVLRHAGAGTLALLDLGIAHGYCQSINAASGGCVLSMGSVLLKNAVVTACKAKSGMSAASGGGIAAHYAVALDHSSVSGNVAMAPTTGAYGGGIRAGSFQSKYSSVSTNSAISGYAGLGAGGGLMVYGQAGIYHSTFDHNSAGFGGAIRANGSMHMSNSTISHNSGTFAPVEVESGISLTAEIANSTIAFNHADDPTRGGGVYFASPLATDALSIYSSIIADNTAGAMNTPSDIYVKNGHGVLSGLENLVIAANVAVPANVITVTSDPMLAPLQTTGGGPATHELLSGSPAISTGNVLASFPLDANNFDERGPGYLRETAIAGNAYVDLGAVQFDRIFVSGFN